MKPDLLRLLTWLSPAFPIGAFAYSHGLERAVHDGLVRDGDDLTAWLEDLVEIGSAWNDAVLLAEAHRRAAAGKDLTEIAQLAEALAGSRERHMETTLQGAAFLAAAAEWPAPLPAGLPKGCAYCVAVGAVAGAHGVAARRCRNGLPARLRLQPRPGGDPPRRHRPAGGDAHARRGWRRICSKPPRVRHHPRSTISARRL